MEATAVVPAGGVCGIGGLGDFVHRTGTLSSVPWCPRRPKHVF